MTIENISKNQKPLDGCASEFIERIKKENPVMGDFILKKYYSLPVNPETEEKTYDYLLETSVIFSAMVSSHGTSVFTEFLYNGVSHPSPADDYVLKSRAGRAVKSRLRALEKNIFSISREILQTQSNLIIGNFGSGPGRDLIDILSDHYKGSSRIRAVNIDKDNAALNRGAVMAKNRGVEKNIEFVCDSLTRYRPREKFDMAVLVGVLCPLDRKTCVEVLSQLKKMVNPGGIIIASNATPEMEREDPFSYFIMRWLAGWHLIFKEETGLKEIFQEAGFEWRGAFKDDYGFHAMGIGRLPSRY